MEIVVLLLFVLTVFLIYRLVSGRKGLKKKGYGEVHSAGTYIGGHPDIDQPIKHAKVTSDNGNVVICSPYYKVKGSIPISKIKDIAFEDATTFGTRVGLGRMALVGIFAFALKKKSKQERAYAVVEWEDGKFTHSTSFLFEGPTSVGSANKLRNKLIRLANA